MRKYIKEVLGGCNNSRDKNRLDEELKQEEQELVETIKYYKIKLEDLEIRAKNRKWFSRGGGTVVTVFFMIFLAIIVDLIPGFLSFTGLDMLKYIYIPLLVAVASQSYTEHINANQMRYACRDELFKNLTKLKRIRALTYDEQVLYNSLMERLS